MAMEEAVSMFRNILRIAGLAAALSSLAACSASTSGSSGSGAKNFLAPAVSVKGSFKAADNGAPVDCKLKMFNLGNGKLAKTFDVRAGSRFKVIFADGAVFDGMRFAVGCKNYPDSNEKTYSADQLGDAGLKLDLGEFVVSTGLVKISGKVVNKSGATPKGCVVGLYKAGVKQPLASWPAPRNFAGEFRLSEAGEFFTFEATCPGYSKRGGSGVYGPFHFDKGSAVTRDLVVKR